MVEQAFLLFHDNFFVRKCGARNGAPIDHTAAAVNQLLLIKVDKDLLNTGGVGRIHREAFA